MPVTPWRTFTARFPGAPRFGIALAGERVVNGGAFIVPAGIARRVETIAAGLFDARKNVFSMARLAGTDLLLRFLLRKLAIGDLERRASALLGVDARAIRNAPAELAYDVDDFAQYRYALAHAS